MVFEGAWRPSDRLVTPEWLASELDSRLVARVMLAERALFDQSVGGPETPLVLFGAGNLGRRVLAGLRRQGIEPLGFADNGVKVQGATVDGLTVYSPEEAVSSFGRDAAFVVTIWTPEPTDSLVFPSVVRQLNGFMAGVRVVPFVPVMWKYAEDYLPYYFLDLPHRIYEDSQAIKSAYELLADAESRAQYLSQLSYLLSDMRSLEVSPVGGPDWYFPRDLFELSDREVFVDCGAYDGDSLICFLEACGGRYGEIMAFECDPMVIPRLEERVSALPRASRDLVHIVPKAVGASRGSLRFNSDGSPEARLSASGAITVECVTLDEALADMRPTFIKMDIEGAEGDALEGAARTIRENRPILAVCIYHRQSDFYRLPAKIHGMCPGYTLFLRRQPGAGDLVCFAVPNERVRR